jgi:hypothetical protein
MRKADLSAWAAIAVTFASALAVVIRHGMFYALSLLAIAAWVATTDLAWRAASRQASRPAWPVDVPEGGDGLDNRAWVRLVEEDIALIDELDRHRQGLDESGRALADHVTARLRELLERADVEVIDEETRFDRLRHAPVDSAGVATGRAATVEVISPGFAIGPRVLRRARVRLRS